MKVLVTGATGNVGYVVAQHLAKQGHEVVATDQSMRPGLQLRPVFANLLDPLACYNLINGMEAVVHLANHPNAGAAPFADLYIENLTVNMNVFQAAADCGVQKLVFASTIQTITGHRPWTEDPAPSGIAYLPADGDLPQRPGNIYALSKCVSEDMLRYYSQWGTMQCIALRLPWVAYDRVTPRPRSKKNWRPRHVNLDECFSYIMVSDVARLIQHILRSDLPGYRTYFPTAADNSSQEPVAELIDRFYAQVPLQKPREQITQLVDCSRITAETGWTPLACLPTTTTC